MTKRPLIAITTSELDCRIEIRGVRQGEAAPSRIAAPRTYFDAVVRAGGVPVLLAALDPESVNADTLAPFDGLLVSGGIDVDPSSYGRQAHPAVTLTEPSADELELAVLAAAGETGLPTLGICRGMQLMNVQRGGTLIQHLPDLGRLHPRHIEVDRSLTHDAIVEPASLLAQVVQAGMLQVNSIHHQAIGDLGANLTVSATASDGVVEAIEDRDLPFWMGVQWHPEERGCLPSVRLIRALIDAAR